MPPYRAHRIPPPVNPQMRQIDVQVYGDRNLPVGRARVPVESLQDFEAAWQGFQKRWPHYTFEQFLRYVLKRGAVAAARCVWLNSIPAPKSD